MTGYSRNENTYLGLAHNVVNPCDHEASFPRWSGNNITSNGQPLEQFNQFSYYDEELYEVTASTVPYQEYGRNISTNWDCQDSSDVSSPPCFLSHPERCLGNKSSAHFESKHTRRVSSSAAFPSAEIPLKMVVGNHHSTQQKIHFSRHLLRKRCFRSTNRCSPGKTTSSSTTKSTKIRLLEKVEMGQKEEKPLVKSTVMMVKTSVSSSPAATPLTSEQSPDDDDDEGDLTQGDRRQIANARERQRVSHLNDGFDKLRRVLPWMRRSRRVSKVDTLRGAIAYIKYLQQQVWARDLTDGCMDCLGAYCLPRSGG